MRDCADLGAESDALPADCVPEVIVEIPDMVTLPEEIPTVAVVLENDKTPLASTLAVHVDINVFVPVKLTLDAAVLATFVTLVTTFAATVGAVKLNETLVTTLVATVAAVTTLVVVVAVTVCVCAPPVNVRSVLPTVSVLACVDVVNSPEPPVLVVEGVPVFVDVCCRVFTNVSV